MPRRLWVKIVADDGGQIGPGKVAVLKAIDAEGSIAAAARALGMSYRRAWKLVEEAGEVAGGALVETRVGGAGKGGAVLNDRGRDLIALFDRVEAQANEAVRKDLAAFFGC